MSTRTILVSALLALAASVIGSVEAASVGYGFVISHVRDDVRWCLSATHGATSNSNLGLALCDFGGMPDNQMWRFDDDGKLRTRLDDSKCMVAGYGTHALFNGIRMRINDCNLSTSTFNKLSMDAANCLRLLTHPNYCITIHGSNPHFTDWVGGSSDNSKGSKGGKGKGKGSKSPKGYSIHASCCKNQKDYRWTYLQINMEQQSDMPSSLPSAAPSFLPSSSPSSLPSSLPTMTPSSSPTSSPMTPSPSNMPSASPSAAPTNAPLETTCISFSYTLMNNRSLTAEDIENETNNTLKAGLIEATRGIVVELLNGTFPRAARRRRLPALQEAAKRALAHGMGMEGYTVRVWNEPMALNNNSTRRSRQLHDTYIRGSRRLVYYSDEFPVEIPRVIDNPNCPSNNVNGENTIRCVIVSSTLCLVLEAGDDAVAIRRTVIEGLRDAISSGEFGKRIPQDRFEGA